MEIEANIGNGNGGFSLKQIYEKLKNAPKKMPLEVVTEEGWVIKIPSDRIVDFTTTTWNPVTGCLHDCNYCFASRLIKSELGISFHPKLNEPEFSRQFNPGDSVFVSDLGDLFGDWVPDEWILRVLAYTQKFPKTMFLLHTKNPARFLDFDFSSMRNIYLGTTIETNRNYKCTKAPPPAHRALAMEKIPCNRKIITIAPIMDFDLDEMVLWMERIRPEGIELGANVYEGCKLPEPSWDKIETLLHRLREICPNVYEKSTLSWLKDKTLPKRSNVCSHSFYYVTAAQGV